MNSLGQGENLAWHSNHSQSADTTWATDAWYNEVVDYNFATGSANSPGKVVGHFTQVVWKNSTKLGCAVAGGNVCCRYTPPGNYLGQYTNNVFPKV